MSFPVRRRAASVDLFDVPRPDTSKTPSRAMQGMGGAEQPGATRNAPLGGREHGEDCEHQTFPGVSTGATLLVAVRMCNYPKTSEATLGDEE